MSLKKLMKNLIVVTFIALIAVLSFFQFKTTSNIIEAGANIKAPFVSIIVFVIIVASIIAIFFILRAILISKNLSKNKIKIFEISYILLIFLITRIIFSVLFLDAKVPFNELMIHKKELELLDPFAKFVILPMAELINKMINFPSLSVFIFNQIIFLISALVFRRILRYTTKSNAFVNIGTFMYIFYPKFMYEGMFINTEIINNMLVLIAIYLIFKILKEIKIVKGKSKKYLIFSILLAIVFTFVTYTISHTFIWILALIVINMFVKNVDVVHVKFSKRTLKKVTSAERAKLYKIEKIYIKKSTVSIALFIVTLFVSKFLMDTTLTAITNKNFHGYKPKEISSLFGTITENYAREQMRDINFIVGEDTKKINYNIGKSIIDILTLNKEGKLKEASNLANSLEKVIEKPMTISQRMKNDAKKMVEIYKNDVTNIVHLNKRVKNKNILSEIMYMSDYIFKSIFVIVLFTEVLHIILRRKRTEKNVIVKLFTISLLLIAFYFGSYHMTNLSVTTLMIIIMFTNILEIYKNRHNKIKVLSEAKYKF